MYSMQTGCYFFTQEEITRIVGWFKERLECLKAFRLTPCKSA